MQKEFAAVVEAVRPVDQTLAQKGQAHLDNLTKPQGDPLPLKEVALVNAMIR